MNNRKLLSILALLLLTPPLYGQESAPPSRVEQNRSVEANDRPQPQPQAQPYPQPPPSGGQASYASPASSKIFEGIVVQADPLEVISVNGDVRTFLPTKEQALRQLKLAWPKTGDLVSLTYEPAPRGDVLKEIHVIGKTIIGTIKEIAADNSWLIVRTQQPEKREYEINVPLQTSTNFQPLVSAMRQGDGIRATYVREGGMNGAEGDNQVKVNHVKSLEWQSKPVGRGARWLSLIVAVVVLFILAYIFTKGHPTHHYLGKDNSYSISKFQTFLWFWLVISAYLAIVSHRIAAAGWSYVGGVDIPPNLLILSGISVLTFTAAKAITAGKAEKAEEAEKTEKPEDQQGFKKPAEEPKISDLVCDDENKPDLGDFQMVAITILAVIIYAISAVEFMENIEFRRVVTMPDVDATLLSIFGLGQAAYLGKKAAGEN
jgi:predicted cobalt transporter CbtA